MQTGLKYYPPVIWACIVPITAALWGFNSHLQVYVIEIIKTEYQTLSFYITCAIESGVNWGHFIYLQKIYMQHFFFLLFPTYPNWHSWLLPSKSNIHFSCTLIHHPSLQANLSTHQDPCPESSLSGLEKKNLLLKTIWENFLLSYPGNVRNNGWWWSSSNVFKTQMKGHFYSVCLLNRWIDAWIMNHFIRDC